MRVKAYSLLLCACLSPAIGLAADKTIYGLNEHVALPDFGLEVPAKLDTGAQTASLSASDITRFKRDGEQYDVIVQFDPARRATPDDISNIFVRARNDTMVPLSSLVVTQETVAARELNHFGQRRAVTITANL
ncbi:MAG: hypothetical protein B7Z23_11720, partial [Pseudomonadales bacterium 32-61-5]